MHSHPELQPLRISHVLVARRMADLKIRRIGSHFNVMAGLAPYTTEDDVDRLVAGIAEFMTS